MITFTGFLGVKCSLNDCGELNIIMQDGNHRDNV